MPELDRSWITARVLSVRWVVFVVATCAYFGVRHLLGVDPRPDWEEAGSVVLLGTLIFLLVWNYGRPRERRPPSSEQE